MFFGAAAYLFLGWAGGRLLTSRLPRLSLADLPPDIFAGLAATLLFATLFVVVLALTP